MVTEQADVKTERRRQREQDPGRSEWAAKAALARVGTAEEQEPGDMAGGRLYQKYEVVRCLHVRGLTTWRRERDAMGWGKWIASPEEAGAAHRLFVRLSLQGRRLA